MGRTGVLAWVLWSPGILGVLSSLIFKVVLMTGYTGPLAWWGLVGLAMSYVVPFTLTLSAVGLAWTFWRALGPGAGADIGRVLTVFMIGVLVSCLHIVLFAVSTSSEG